MTIFPDCWKRFSKAWNFNIVQTFFFLESFNSFWIVLNSDIWTYSIFCFEIDLLIFKILLELLFKSRYINTMQSHPKWCTEWWKKIKKKNSRSSLINIFRTFDKIKLRLSAENKSSENGSKKIPGRKTVLNLFRLFLNSIKFHDEFAMNRWLCFWDISFTSKKRGCFW